MINVYLSKEELMENINNTLPIYSINNCDFISQDKLVILKN